MQSAMTNPTPRNAAPGHGRLARTALLLLLLTTLLPRAAAQDLLTEQHLEQRQQYLEALAALARHDRASFDARRTELNDYALRPYLDYAELSERIDSLPEIDVHDFLAANAGTVLAQRLRQQWLQALADAGQWQQLVADYDADSATTELNCQALNARLQSGDTAALDEVAALWKVPRSQPNGCDPLFDAWRAAGRLTPALAWERFSAALTNGDTSLANYVATLLPPREQKLATLWLDTAKRPQLLREQANYAGNDPELNAILLHTLRRLAQSDADLAWDLAENYAAQRGFSAADSLELRRYIAQRLLSQDEVPRAETLLRADPALPSDTLVEWLLRDALKQQQWERFDSWLPLLSTDASNSERWRYWRARSLQRHDMQNADAQALLAALAETRSFYGFLAADLLGRNYALVDRPLQISETELAVLLTKPPLTRAFELFLVGDETNALREWQQALTTMSEEEVLAAGKLAERVGWYRNGITALSQVSYWDDLTVRFPLAYRDLVGAQASQYQGLDSTFVYAIARQESAFISNARSSAGALGLMQLMPGTARDTARAIGLSLGNNQDILEPGINLTLGSRYLSKMLQDFGGNRILAAAAYNAGPARVRQWLEQTDSQRPFDIWIETIPFGETRNYVQNVLTYAVIYGYRMEAPVPLLTALETQTPL
jgi:soluble lytic murein transglycosylase